MRLLVIEDEELLAASIKAGLEEEGFAVDVAHDGEVGLWHIQEHSYDAVILDLMLPKVNGYKVCASLREQGNWVPILMLTAKTGEWDVAEGLDTGADDYLTKPFSFVILLARIRALLRRGTTERPAVMQAGGLQLDPATRSVEIDGRPVDFTAKEFAVLHFLMRHAGEVVSKTDIVENVWDVEFDSDLNIVEVYVGSLRKKLGKGAIETIRGAGYRLSDDATGNVTE